MRRALFILLLGITVAGAQPLAENALVCAYLKARSAKLQPVSTQPKLLATDVRFQPLDADAPWAFYASALDSAVTNLTAGRTYHLINWIAAATADTTPRLPDGSRPNTKLAVVLRWQGRMVYLRGRFIQGYRMDVPEFERLIELRAAGKI